MKIALLPILGISLSTFAQDNTGIETVYVTTKGLNSSLYTQSTDIQTIYLDSMTSMKGSLSDILADAPGVHVTQNGGGNQDTNVQLDGINLKNSLVLINGQAIGSATLGQASLNKIQVNQVERIEILKGSGSSLYGSSAMGGVINIITKQDSNSLTISTGSLGKHEVAINLNNSSINGITSGFNASYQTTKGINSRTGDYYDFASSSNVEYDQDKDGSNNSTITGFVNYIDNQPLKISTSIYLSQGELEYDSFGGDDQSSYQNSQFNTQANYSTDYAELSLLASRQIDRSKNFGVINTKENADEFNTTTDYVSLQGQFKSDYFETILGADWKDDDISESNILTPYQKDNAQNTSIYTQVSAAPFDGTLISTGTRIDDHSAFGQHQTFNLSLRKKIENHSITITGESGFKAPSFNDLYFPSSGNADLKPEESIQSSIRYGFRNDSSEYNVKIYRSELDNLIAWAPTEADPNIWKPANVNKAIIKGWRVNWLENWSSQLHTNLSATRTLTKNIEDNQQLAFTPEYSAKAQLGYNYKNLTLSTSLNHVGNRLGSDRFEILKSYTVADLSVVHQLNATSSIGFIVQNVTDKNYIPNTQYSGTPRNIQLNYMLDL